MGPLLVLIFFVLPIVEIAVLVSIGRVVGVGPTILALIAFSIAGAVLAKREGAEVWRRFKRTLSRGQIPSTEIADGMLVLFGAALLLTPGFVTDVLGLVLLVPVTRGLVRQGLIRGSGWWIGRRFGIAGWSGPARTVVSVASAARRGKAADQARGEGAKVSTPSRKDQVISTPLEDAPREEQAVEATNSADPAPEDGPASAPRKDGPAATDPKRPTAGPSESDFRTPSDGAGAQQRSGDEHAPAEAAGGSSA